MFPRISLTARCLLTALAATACDSGASGAGAGGAGGGFTDARHTDAVVTDAAGAGGAVLRPDAVATDAEPAPTADAHAAVADAAPPAPDVAVGPAADAGAPPPPPPGGHPNFIFILGEARGWTSTSVLQDEENPDSRSPLFQTPNLDRLAGEGMTFSDFYAPSPRCMPSRASYFAGRSPAQLHMTFIPEGNRDGATMGQVVPPETVTDLPTDIPNVASVLKGVGYATAHFGKWHAGRTDPGMYGFDESDGPTSNRGPDGTMHPNPQEAFGTMERGLDFMQRNVAAATPFYLQISHYGGDDEANSLPETFAAESARLAGQDVKTIGEAAVIHDMDTTIGRILDEVDALGIGENTYVFFSADHGRAGARANEPLNQGKGSVWEGGIRVPLLIRGPGIPRRTHSHVRATQVDLMPTLMELAGVPGPMPPELEGGSLWSVLTSGTGEVVRSRSEFVVHFPHYDKDPLGPASAIIAGDFKLIRFYEDGSLRLYNLAQDLGEQNDLAAQLPDRVAELDGRLTDILNELGAQLPGHQ